MIVYKAVWNYKDSFVSWYTTPYSIEYKIGEIARPSIYNSLLFICRSIPDMKKFIYHQCGSMYDKAVILECETRSTPARIEKVAYKNYELLWEDPDLIDDLYVDNTQEYVYGVKSLTPIKVLEDFTL